MLIQEEETSEAAHSVWRASWDSIKPDYSSYFWGSCTNGEIFAITANISY